MPHVMTETDFLSGLKKNRVSKQKNKQINIFEK